MRYETVTVSGVRTRFLASGDGPRPLVLVHGGGVGPETWIPLMERLGAEFTMFAPDLLGHGETVYALRRDRGPHRTLADHLLDFAASVGLDRCDFAGSSVGAHLCLLAALERPATVSALTLFGSATAFAPVEQALAVLERHRRTRQGSRSASTVAQARALIDGYVAVDQVESADVIAHAVAQAAARLDVAASRERLFAELSAPEAVTDSHVASRLDAIDAPALVVWGRQDPVAPVALAAPAAAAFRHGRLAVLEDCGHLPYLEAPDEVADLMRSV